MGELGIGKVFFIWSLEGEAALFEGFIYEVGFLALEEIGGGVVDGNDGVVWVDDHNPMWNGLENFFGVGGGVGEVGWHASRYCNRWGAFAYVVYCMVYMAC